MCNDVKINLKVEGAEQCVEELLKQLENPFGDLPSRWSVGESSVRWALNRAYTKGWIDGLRAKKRRHGLGV